MAQTFSYSVKVSNCLIKNTGIIFLIMGSANFGPVVAGPAGPIPTPLIHTCAYIVTDNIYCLFNLKLYYYYYYVYTLGLMIQMK